MQAGAAAFFDKKDVDLFLAHLSSPLTVFITKNWLSGGVGAPALPVCRCAFVGFGLEFS